MDNLGEEVIRQPTVYAAVKRQTAVSAPLVKIELTIPGMSATSAASTGIVCLSVCRLVMLQWRRTFGHICTQLYQNQGRPQYLHSYCGLP